LIHRDIRSRIIAGALALFGIAALLAGAAQVLDGVRNSTWPQVSGKVLRYERSNFGFTSGRDAPKITYEYYIDGQRFEGNVISAGGSRPDFSRSHLFATPGQVITVSYNPKSPEQAVIISGITSTSYFTIAIGTMLLLLAAAVARLISAPVGSHRSDA
jgi:hypothetical protein